ncbi:MAG: hypothetical protein Q8R21_02420, partial [Burkholderiales bacterium]|nr:hypothetical protein [Burkholderiales bacterium]
LAEAKAKGLRLAASETYPPDDHPRWGHSVGRLLKIPEGFRHNKNVPLPMPDFGAVFVPVDWDKAELQLLNLKKTAVKTYLYDVFIERIATYRAHPPEAEWKGVHKFETK